MGNKNESQTKDNETVFREIQCLKIEIDFYKALIKKLCISFPNFPPTDSSSRDPLLNEHFKLVQVRNDYAMAAFSELRRRDPKNINKMQNYITHFLNRYVNKKRSYLNPEDQEYFDYFKGKIERKIKGFEILKNADDQFLGADEDSVMNDFDASSQESRGLSQFFSKNSSSDSFYVSPGNIFQFQNERVYRFPQANSSQNIVDRNNSQQSYNNNNSFTDRSSNQISEETKKSTPSDYKREEEDKAKTTPNNNRIQEEISQNISNSHLNHQNHYGSQKVSQNVDFRDNKNFFGQNPGQHPKL